MKKNNLSNLLVLVSILLLWSCGGGSNQESSGDSDAYDQAEQSLSDKIQDVAYNVPPPTEIPYLIQATGADYDQSLITDDAMADKFLNQSEKAALLLGVYAADIGYLSSYDKTQGAIDHLNACKKLADNLGIIGSFDINYLKRFESNISNKDSLAILLNEAVTKTDKFLRDDSRTKLSALVITGSFIEGLSISTGIINSFPKNLLPDDQRNLVLAPIVNIVESQSKSVDEIISLLGTVEATDPVPDLLTDLQALQKSYQAIDLKEQVKNNQLTDVLTDVHLMEITKITAQLKSKITQ